MLDLSDGWVRRQPAALSLGGGCTSDGPEIFIGEPGNRNAGGLNYAGGGTPNGGYAAVVAGIANEACDGESAVLAGFINIVGGDGYSLSSVIAGGNGNAIASSASFIGAGQENDMRRAQSDADHRLEAKYERLERRLDAIEARARPTAIRTRA